MKMILNLKIDTRTYTLTGRECVDPKCFLYFDVNVNGDPEACVNMQSYFHQEIDAELLKLAVDTSVSES